jgi:hypothetical protein
MRLAAATLLTAMILAPSLRAAPPSAISVDQVKDAVADVLQQEGISPDTAAELAARIARRLAGASEPEAPALSDKERPVVPGDWQDALATEAQPVEAPAAEAALVTGAERPYPENVANFVIQETEEATRVVILKHLNEIEQSGIMSAAIATDDYWRQVFLRHGYSDMYEVSRDMIKKALRAGLRPYKEGKGLDAREFAQLAARAIHAPTTLAASGDLTQP